MSHKGNVYDVIHLKSKGNFVHVNLGFMNKLESVMTKSGKLRNIKWTRTVGG